MGTTGAPRDLTEENRHFASRKSKLRLAGEKKTAHGCHTFTSLPEDCLGPVGDGRRPWNPSRGLRPPGLQSTASSPEPDDVIFSLPHVNTTEQIILIMLKGTLGAQGSRERRMQQGYVMLAQTWASEFTDREFIDARRALKRFVNLVARHPLFSKVVVLKLFLSFSGWVSMSALRVSLSRETLSLRSCSFSSLRVSGICRLSLGLLLSPVCGYRGRASGESPPGLRMESRASGEKLQDVQNKLKESAQCVGDEFMNCKLATRAKDFFPADIQAQFAISQELIWNIYNNFHKLRDRAEWIVSRAIDNAADLLIFWKQLRQVTFQLLQGQA
ncbi:hypothetical protein P7K49_003502, partial [Saguinus oedipus]